ncbi:MAG: D-alanyl-D-alanine carboxypeptidase family protein [Oscillospiraceae bacterium]|jgi:D-alanyl-D-alanine carboxypeptidase (penicillin-binding protein 5/6)|nr:D-alanyl-D-alanine carboxypeptidase family protein [Oscillospiraceae bacterium]
MNYLLRINKVSEKLICFIIIFALASIGIIVPIYAEDDMNLNCKSAVLMDYGTGKIIYEQNSHEKLAPASVTKVMTMLLVMEALDRGKISYDDKVTISPQASSKNNKGTMLLLEAGEVRTVKELMYGIAVESANDACIAMAEHISGSKEEFVKLMNRRAKELGANESNFLNPNGLPEDGHVTTAYDLAVLSRELLKHEKIFDFISKYMVKVYVGKKNNVLRELVNKNKMVRFYDDVDGIKTGWTDEAGYCISLTAKRNDLRFISVVMGSPKVDIRNKEARKLIDYGFANFNSMVAVKKGEKVQEVKVSKGSKLKVNAVAESDISVLLNKGEEKNIAKRAEVPEILNAPLKKDEKIGELVVSLNDKEVGRYNLVCDTDVNKSTFLNNLKNSFIYWFGNCNR